jgi:hypothetical protein
MAAGVMEFDMLNAFSEFGVLCGLGSIGKNCRTRSCVGRYCRSTALRVTVSWRTLEFSGGAGMACRLLATFCLLMVCLVTAAEGQSGRFPYEARVAAEETFARSGGGDAYYPTQRLSRGTIVRVHRHDPGGWYVIEPPEGSFSWIPERFVKRLSEQEGEVLEENVVASVGSEFGDETSVYQRKMKSGEKVTILGQKTIETAAGPQAMLKIRPPNRERRWVPGAALVPTDPEQQRQADNDPWRLPANGRRATAMSTPASAVLPAGMVEVPLIEPSEALQKVQQDRDEKQQLAEIDRRFREMVLQDAATWDLDSLEAAYRELQGRLKNPQISGAVELRYGALQRYRQRLAELQQVRQLQSQTEQRDAALAARHGFASMMPPAVPTARIAPPRIAAVPVEPAPVVPAPAESATGGVIVDAAAGAAEVDEFVTPTPDSALPPSGSNSNSGMLVSQSRSVAEQSVSTEAAVEPLTAAVSGAGVIRPGSPQNKYVGAGIVQRSPDAGGAWVLTAPAGKVLANLKPAAGVQLERFAGRQVGILGMRWSQKDQRDMIEVRGLEPVQLTP